MLLRLCTASCGNSMKELLHITKFMSTKTPQRNLWKAVDRSGRPGSLACKITGPIINKLLLESHDEFYLRRRPFLQLKTSSLEYQ
ncbi:hypothetical protein TNCV_5014551 [Trichonephila clavipes]|nr:hypothetical protein TNCV_5014551 [Trichonephila clavipes]